MLDLTKLTSGMPGITPSFGRVLMEAASVCLENCAHPGSAQLTISGISPRQVGIWWQPTDDRCRKCYADLQEATEWGAYGLAVLIAKLVTGLVVVSRSAKGTGFDYWLGDEADNDDEVFGGGLSRLEVSGIMKGTPQLINARLKQKWGQIAVSDTLGPGYIAVIEFSNPFAALEKK